MSQFIYYIKHMVLVLTCDKHESPPHSGTKYQGDMKTTSKSLDFFRILVKFFLITFYLITQLILKDGFFLCTKF